MGHIAHRLQAYLAGRVTPAEREQADMHLAGCASCREELDLLRDSQAVLAPLADFEPRAGFAASVALAARERRRPAFAGWLRWSFGGLAMAGAAALAIVVSTPHAPVVHNDELVLAQRLDLYEDMDVAQHQEALEDLDVVEVLHTLQEAQP